MSLIADSHFQISLWPLFAHIKMMMIALFVAILASAAVFCQGETTVINNYFKAGSACSVSTGLRDATISTGYCLPTHHAEQCNGKTDMCGVLYSCTLSTVTISYWYSAGDQCLRGDAQHTNTYPTETCLPPSTGYDSYNGSDSIFHCK